MAVLHVRRAGNSLALLLPKKEADELHLHEGDTVQVEIHKVASLLELSGSLKGRVRSKELHALTNEGEEIG